MLLSLQDNAVVYFYDRMQGKNVALQNREEWCIISKTLLASTNQWCIHRKCTERTSASCGMEGSTSRVTTKYGPNNPTRYGWELDHEHILQPRTVPSGTLSAPPEILQLIRCSCQTSAACSCSKLRCTIFCACEGGQACENPLTQRSSELEASGMAIHETDED